MRRIRILGSQQNDREYLHEALQIAASGKVKVMTETYSLDVISKAYERVAEPTKMQRMCFGNRICRSRNYLTAKQGNEVAEIEK